MRILSILLMVLILISCDSNDNIEISDTNESKIGVLLVSHGSRSETWRKMLLDIEDSVKTRVLANSKINDIKSAFMEYNGPSIADQMKVFDKEGYTDVIVVPIFLTVSSHSFDDIPTIVGLKKSESEIEQLKQEKIEVYDTKANVVITPLLDFPDLLTKNAIRRVKSMSTSPANEGVSFIAYGDLDYNKEWTELMERLMASVDSELGINKSNYAWCGHIASYKTEPTTDAVNEILKEKDTDIVIPILVAYDEMFQTEIIAKGIEKSANKDAVRYKSDAILPDMNLNDWIVNISNEYVEKVFNK